MLVLLKGKDKKDSEVPKPLDPVDIQHLSYTDPYNLKRFVAAQDNYVDYDKVLEELRKGKKKSHWMWFVFPTLVKELQSPMSRYYSLKSELEAKAYLDNEVLRKRLNEAVELVALSERRTAQKIFGHIDTEKLFESMTLFNRIDPSNKNYFKVLEKYYEGKENERIVAALENPSYKYCPVAASYGDLFQEKEEKQKDQPEEIKTQAGAVETPVKQ